MAYTIETSGLTKDFGALRAVDHLDLQVERGSFYGFLGPNGAGKSTTIKMLTGLLAPTAGSTQLLGEDFKANALSIKARIGVLPEDQCLFENLTGREFLTFMGRMYRLPKHDVLTRTEELLKLMGLHDDEKTLVAKYSTGMKKKLSLAAALIHDPELIFLDEPFEGVDAIASRTIRGVLARLIERGATIFLTSHILEVVERLCTHVGIIHEGKLVVQGSMAELAEKNTLENAFIEAVGQSDQPEQTLSWLAE